LQTRVQSASGPELPADPHHVDQSVNRRADAPIDLELVAAPARVLEAQHDRLDPGAVDEIKLGEVEPHRAAVLAMLAQPLLDGIGDSDVKLSDQSNAQCTVAVDAFSYLKRWAGEWHEDSGVSNGRGLRGAQS
jgi:hypothetical protein